MNISPRLRLFISSSILEVILVLLCIILAFTASGFLTADNLLNILRNISMQGVIAFGMTMVIISGEIDLSVGSAVAFAACLTAFLTQKLGGEWASFPISLAITVSIVVTLGIGFLFGAFTGFMRNRYQVPSFITTLALMTGLSGAAELITNGFPLTPFPAWYNFIGGGYVLGIPFPAILFLLTFAVLQFLMTSTSFGRTVYAVGGNAEAARLSGINVRRVKTIVFGITAFLAALSGVMVSSEIMSGTATTAKGWELDVIAAVIIGGTSFLGGVGRIWGTLIGVVFLGVMMNGMTLLNVSEYWQHVARGTIILIAVLLNLLQKEKGAR